MEGRRSAAVDLRLSPFSILLLLLLLPLQVLSSLSLLLEPAGSVNKEMKTFTTLVL